MSEYGANHTFYQTIQGFVFEGGTDALKKQFEKSIDVLELTEWQKKRCMKLK